MDLVLLSYITREHPADTAEPARLQAILENLEGIKGINPRYRLDCALNLNCVLEALRIIHAATDLTNARVSDAAVDRPGLDVAGELYRESALRLQQSL